MMRIAFLPLLFLAGATQGFSNAQSFSDVTVETLVRDAHYAEGPVWSPEGFLLFSDTVTDQLKKWTPGKGVSDYAQPAGRRERQRLRRGRAPLHLRISRAARHPHRARTERRRCWPRASKASA